MAFITLAEQSLPAVPTSGDGALFVDSGISGLGFRGDDGVTHYRHQRASTAAQGAGFAADTYVTDSGLLVPSSGFQVGMVFLWRISASKTAAGVATPAYSVRIGTTQTTADTAQLVLTGPAQTAVADVGLLTLMVIVRSVSATGTIAGSAHWAKDVAAATGFGGSVEGTSAAFDDSALSGQYVGLSINGGAAAAWTITQVFGQLLR